MGALFALGTMQIKTSQETYARRYRRAARRKRQYRKIKRIVDRFFAWATCVVWADCTFTKRGVLHTMATIAETECPVCMFGRGWAAGLAVGFVVGLVFGLAL